MHREEMWSGLEHLHFCFSAFALLTTSVILRVCISTLPQARETCRSANGSLCHFSSTIWEVFFFSSIVYFILFFYYTILYWFCHTSTCIWHGCTRVPHPEPPSHLPHHTIPLGHPSAPAPSFLYPASNLDWRFISYMILYMFDAILPNHTRPPLSHRVQKTVLYICVSFAVSHTGSSLPSF